MTEQNRLDPYSDVGDFKPKTNIQPPADQSVVDKLSKENGFHSREPQKEKPVKTGRFGVGVPRKQLNLKVSEDCHAQFYEMAESRNIRTLGDLLQLALDALKEKDSQSHR